MAHGDSATGFAFMALSHTIRDALKSRQPYLDEAGLRAGMKVLDFGCGSGSYVAPSAQMVGRSGLVYALDRNPSALKMTSARATRAKLTNVKTLLSDCATGLTYSSVDAVLLYDIFHELEEPNEILKELHRVLKPSGILSAHDHHIGSQPLTQAIVSSGLFRMTHVGALTLTFAPEGRYS
jgi:ubiquinone/menaquinone biosynthesis C-methylase UbiE